MPTALRLKPSFTEAPRKRWTREEFEELSNNQFSGERLELIDGDLISKMGKNRPHSHALLSLYKWLISTFGFDFISPEAPIDVSRGDRRFNRPEPDLCVLKGNVFELGRLNPQPEGLHLVVEVADTTLSMDLSAKARLYARAGIIEYWVLDVSGRRMIVHRDPRNDRYKSVIAYGETERISALAAPEAELLVGNVLLSPE